MISVQTAESGETINEAVERVLCEQEPSLPDDSPAGIAERCWQDIERGTDQKMTEKPQTIKHFSCPVCGSEETVILQGTLRRRRGFANFGGLEVPLPKLSIHRDLLCQCNNTACQEGHGTQHFQWIEEVPEHES